MKYNSESIYELIEIIEYYIYQQYNMEESVVVKDYLCDHIKFHTWTISPICLNGKTYTIIKLSDVAIDYILQDMNKFSFDDILYRNMEVLKDCLQ